MLATFATKSLTRTLARRSVSRSVSRRRPFIRNSTLGRASAVVSRPSNPSALARCLSTQPTGSDPGAGFQAVIGDVQLDVPAIDNVRNPEFVPSGYLPDVPSQQLLGHLRWIMQKDSLGQDMFLLGAPGPTRRHVALQFCELARRECEVLVLSRDTTESDLKQRREIVSGDGIMTDQAPVRAAINGRILVLDGMERVERNVLPTLNNLLENREMALDDGRFLMAAEAYDALLKEQNLTVEDMVRTATCIGCVT